MKKYKVQLEKFKKCCFSGENRLFRQFLESSRFKNKFYWQLNHAWWWALLVIIFLSEKTTKYKEKVQLKSAKMVSSDIFLVFLAGKKIFSKIGLGHVLSIANTHLCAKNQKKLMMKSRENAQKLVFPAYFCHFRPESHFGHYHFASLCQKSAKANEPIGNGRTNERTDGRLIYRTSKVGPKTKQVSGAFVSLK